MSKSFESLKALLFSTLALSILRFFTNLGIKGSLLKILLTWNFLHLYSYTSEAVVSSSPCPFFKDYQVNFNARLSFGSNRIKFEYNRRVGIIFERIGAFPSIAIELQDQVGVSKVKVRFKMVRLLLFLGRLLDLKLDFFIKVFFYGELFDSQVS